MSDDLNAELRLAMMDAYDRPFDAPGLAGRVPELYARRRTRRRVVVPLAVLVVAALVVVPFALRGGSSGPAGRTGPTGVTASASAPAPAPSSSFAELQGWWRFTHLQAPGGSVPILQGMPAFLHFDSETAAAAEIGNNTTSFGFTDAGGVVGLTPQDTSAVSSAPGENAVEGYLDHVTGAVSAVVTGDTLTVTGPDGSAASLARTVKPANPAAWTCCEPTSQPTAAAAPAGLAPCRAADLTGAFHRGYTSEYDDDHEVLIRTTSQQPCLLSGSVTASYERAGGSVTPLHPDRQQVALPTAVALSPTALTPAQDADQAWTSALTIALFSQSTPESDPQSPCPGADVVTITKVTLALSGGSLAVPIPGGLATCSAAAFLGEVDVR